MRRWLVVGLAVVLALGVVATAYAGMRFKRVTTKVVEPRDTSTARTVSTAAGDPIIPNAELRIIWVAQGVGDDEELEYEAAADVAAVYACLNNGGQIPSASNKITVTGHVVDSGTAISDHTRKVKGKLTTDDSLPSPGDFTCPPGQTLVLAEVRYTNIVLTDLTNEGSTDAPDASKVYFPV